MKIWNSLQPTDEYNLVYYSDIDEGSYNSMNSILISFSTARGECHARYLWR